jgi:tRNA 2-(methylsulfanyl)-N6-isopentenyladenosine37 hydroxylase
MLCLTVPTDPGWAAAAIADADAVLVDHAHCEIKAASNALSLAARHPDDAHVVRSLTDLAREEVEHFRHVFDLVVARGLTLGRPPVDRYAADLRRSVQGLPRDARLSPLVDRLLVGALIEARSCERFKLLAQASADEPSKRELCVLWTELLASEARHYRTFVDLAGHVAGGLRHAVERRLEVVAAREGEIVRALAQNADRASRAAIHG